MVEALLTLLVFATFIALLVGLNIVLQMGIHWIGVRANERDFNRRLAARRAAIEDEARARYWAAVTGKPQDEKPTT